MADVIAPCSSAILALELDTAPCNNAILVLALVIAPCNNATLIVSDTILAFELNATPCNNAILAFALFKLVCKYIVLAAAVLAALKPEPAKVFTPTMFVLVCAVTPNNKLMLAFA